MSKHRTFKQFYEDVTVADALGGSPGSTDSISGSDFYAPGDSRVPKLLWTTSRRGKIKRKLKKKHKNKRK